MPSAIRSPVRTDFVAAVTTSTSMRSAVKQRRSFAECKARGNGGGFVQLERWLGEYDLLVLKRAPARTGAAMTARRRLLNRRGSTTFLLARAKAAAKADQRSCVIASRLGPIE